MINGQAQELLEFADHIHSCSAEQLIIRCADVVDQLSGIGHQPGEQSWRVQRVAVIRWKHS